MLHLGQGEVSIYLSSLRPSLGTTGFHQNLQSSGGVVGLLRMKGVKCVIYLDDLLIMAADRNQATLQCVAATRLLKSLGFLPKSQTEPTQKVTFLGLKLTLPGWKLTEIQVTASL